ncbi:hypothetical protein CL657_02235 [bacterium]|nr:hypothetical protein [bacterium]
MSPQPSPPPPQISNPSESYYDNSVSNKLATLLKKDPVAIAEELFKDDALCNLLKILKMNKEKYPNLFETNLEVKIVALLRKITPEFQSVIQNTSNKKETLTYRLFCQKYLSLYTRDEINKLKNLFELFTNQHPNPPENLKIMLNSEELKALYHFCIIKDLAKNINKQTKIETAYTLLALSQSAT